MMKRMYGVVCVLLLLGLAACDAEGDPEMSPAGASEAAAEQTDDYQVLLGNAISDTLRGRARFGRVLLSEEREEVFVIEMETGYDFAGGLFIAYAGEGLPRAQTYQIETPVDSAGAPVDRELRVVYQEGMLRHLQAHGGTVTFETVTDTLITGTLDVTLRGRVYDRRRQLEQAEVHARGRFAARPGSPGYLIGL